MPGQQQTAAPRIIMTIRQPTKSATSTTSKIFVLGGYGAVGKLIAIRLAKRYPGAVVVAGRDGEKARALSASIPGTTHAAIDAYNPDSYAPIFAPENKTRIVISCVELPPNNALAQEILAHGIHFTELTATYEAHEKILALQKVATEHNSSAIVGVGLMPGLSNIMAYDLSQYFDDIDRIEINLMLGLGDSHGLDAVKWTLRNLTSTYEVVKAGQPETVKSFTDPHKATFIDERKSRYFYRFDFSDQHMLTHSVKTKQISSRLAFDSRLATRSLGWLRKIGALSVIKDKHAEVAHKIMHAFPLGSDQWALQVEAHGSKGDKKQSRNLLARGHVEAAATAIIATYVVSRLYENKLPSGVHSVETVVDAKRIYSYARQNDIVILQ